VYSRTKGSAPRWRFSTSRADRALHPAFLAVKKMGNESELSERRHNKWKGYQTSNFFTTVEILTMNNSTYTKDLPFMGTFKERVYDIPAFSKGIQCRLHVSFGSDNDCPKIHHAFYGIISELMEWFEATCRGHFQRKLVHLLCQCVKVYMCVSLAERYYPSERFYTGRSSEL